MAKETKTTAATVAAPATAAFASKNDGKTIKSGSGYYLDPVTLKPFTKDTPRSRACSWNGTTFVWPMVKTSEGNEVRIAYSEFTEQEKKWYKEYHPSTGSGSGNGGHKLSEDQLKVIKEIEEQINALEDKEAAKGLLASLKKLIPETAEERKAREQREAVKAQYAAMSEEDKKAMLAFIMGK